MLQDASQITSISARQDSGEGMIDQEDNTMQQEDINQRGEVA